MRELRLLATAAVLAYLSLGEGEWALELRLIAEPDTNPVIHNARLRESNCGDCESRDLKLIDGKTVSLLVERKPRLVFARSEIQRLRAGEVRSISDPNFRYWEVGVIPTENALPRITELAKAFPNQRVLISAPDAAPVIGGTVEMATTLGFWVGDFATEQEALEFSKRLGIETEWVKFNEETYKKNREWYEKAQQNIRGREQDIPSRPEDQ
jgi:hypothetical protein